MPIFEIVAKRLFSVEQTNFSTEKHQQGLIEQVLAFLNLDPKGIRKKPKTARDVSGIGHVGAGNLEIRISSGRGTWRLQSHLSKWHTKGSVDNFLATALRASPTGTSTLLDLDFRQG
jgi:hypothetical protein